MPVFILTFPAWAVILALICISIEKLVKSCRNQRKEEADRKRWEAGERARIAFERETDRKLREAREAHRAEFRERIAAIKQWEAAEQERIAAEREAWEANHKQREAREAAARKKEWEDWKRRVQSDAGIRL